MILCATDFSFIELVCFAQSCYTRFGKSVMRDVINAGVDPHRWFAGVMHNLIPATTEELSKPDYVVELNAMLEREVKKKWRQDAKAAKPKLALHRVTYVEEESELLGKVQPTRSAAEHTDGQNARCMKVQRPSRQGVGHMPEALLLRNE